MTPLLTIALIAANAIVFFGVQPSGDPFAEVEFLFERAAVACEVTGGEPLTVAEVRSGRCLAADGTPAFFPEKRIALSVVTSMFLHGGLLHLLGNMWFLWVFGNNVEEAFGRFGFAALYLVAGVASTLAFVSVNPDSTVPLVGASGAIAGVLGAYLVLFPSHWVVALIVFYAVPVPALLFLGVWFLGQFAVDDPGVAWEAHVGGFIVGAAVALALRGPLLARVRRLHRPATWQGTGW